MPNPGEFYVADQLGRIDRTIERLGECNAVTDDNFHALKDAFIEFCIHCYHLKDIVAQSGFRSKDEVESFVEGSFWLKGCGNVANKAKHHKRRPGSEHEPRIPKLVGELLPIIRARNPWENRNELKLEIGKRGYNCLEFARNARQGWGRFLR